MWIFIASAGVLCLFAVFVATRPPAYRVVRELAVAAPAERVFGVVNDLRQLAGVLHLFGTPLDKLDPDMQKTVEGPSSGVGQSYAWVSKKDAGTGRMTISESIPAQRVGISLEYVKPMASKATCTLSFAATPSGTTVTWSMEGNHNFIGRAFGVFVNLDRMIGRDVEKGLAELKTLAERA